MRFAVLLFVLCGLLYAPPASAAGCARKDGNTRYADKRVRVYSDHGIWFGCLRAMGRSTVMNTLGGPWTGFKTNGRYLKAEVLTQTRTYGDWELSIRTFDLRKRRVHYEWFLHQRAEPTPAQPAPLAVENERLKRNGSYAMLAGPHDAPGDVGGYAYGVYRFDTSGYTTLSTNPGVDPKSFRATRTEIAWTEAGSEQRAPFR
jgi:hypothetical protein